MAATKTERMWNREADLKWLADYGPLPSVEELVGPLLQTIWTLHNLGERVDVLEMLSEDDAGSMDHARELADLIHRMIQLSTVTGRSCVVDDGHTPSRVASAIRLFIETISRAAILEHIVDTSEAFRIGNPPRVVAS